MKYSLEVNDVFEYLGNDYVTIDIANANNRKFILTNKLLNENEPSKELVIFEMLPEGLIITDKDDKDVDKICNDFSYHLNEMVDYYREVAGEN